MQSACFRKCHHHYHRHYNLRHEHRHQHFKSCILSNDMLKPSDRVIVSLSWSDGADCRPGVDLLVKEITVEAHKEGSVMRKGSIHGFTKLLQWLIDSDRCGKWMRMNEVKKDKKVCSIDTIFVLPKEKIAQLGNDLFGGVPAIEPCHELHLSCEGVFARLQWQNRQNTLKIPEDPWRSLKYCLISFDPEVTHDLEKWWVKVPYLLIIDAFKDLYPCDLSFPSKAHAIRDESDLTSTTTSAKLRMVCLPEVDLRREINGKSNEIQSAKQKDAQMMAFWTWNSHVLKVFKGSVAQQALQNSLSRVTAAINRKILRRQASCHQLPSSGCDGSIFQQAQLLVLQYIILSASPSH